MAKHRGKSLQFARSPMTQTGLVHVFRKRFLTQANTASGRFRVLLRKSDPNPSPADCAKKTISCESRILSRIPFCAFRHQFGSPYAGLPDRSLIYENGRFNSPGPPYCLGSGPLLALLLRDLFGLINCYLQAIQPLISSLDKFIFRSIYFGPLRNYIPILTVHEV